MLLLAQCVAPSLWRGGGGLGYGLVPGWVLRSSKYLKVNLCTDINCIVCKMCFDSKAVDDPKSSSKVNIIFAWLGFVC